MKVWRKQRGLQVPRVPLNSTRTRTYSTSSHQSPPYTMMVAIGKASIKQIYVYIIFHIYTYRYTCTYMYIYISNIGPHCNGLQYHPPCGWHSRCSHGRHGSKSIRAPDFTDDPMCSNSKMLELCPKHMDEMQWLIVLPQILLCTVQFHVTYSRFHSSQVVEPWLLGYHWKNPPIPLGKTGQNASSWFHDSMPAVVPHSSLR